MGRAALTPDEWLKDDEVMLDWLKGRLERSGAYVVTSPDHGRRHSLLYSLHNLVRREDGEEEFRKLKESWRRHKSDLKQGLESVQVKLDPATKKRLLALSKETSVHKTVSRLINEEALHLKDRRKAIHAAMRMHINEQENSAIAQLEKLNSKQARLKSDKHQLEAKNVALRKELSNVLLILSEFEIATDSLAGDNLKLNSENKISAVKRRDELLDYYLHRVEASASLPAK